MEHRAGFRVIQAKLVKTRPRVIAGFYCMGFALFDARHKFPRSRRAFVK